MFLISMFNCSRGHCPRPLFVSIWLEELVRTAQQFFRRNILGEFRAQKSLVRSVLQQSPDKVGHSRQQLADRAVFANAITHFDQRALDRAGHAIQQLKFETAAIDPEFVRDRLRVRDAADIVRPEGGGNDRFIFQQHTREGFEIHVALRLLKIDRTIPSVLLRFNCFVIPVRALHQPHRETRAPCTTPFDQIAEIGFGVAQIRLNNDPGVGPVLEFSFAESCLEQLERNIFMRVAFHIEIDEGAEFAGAAQNWSQLRREMRNGVSRIGRIYLRIERRDFHGEIYKRKKLGIFSARIGPASRFAREALQQIEATHRIFIGLFFTEDSLAQKIDSEPNLLRLPLAQRFHYILTIFSGDKLARHSGNIPSQDKRTDPWDYARHAHPGPNHWREAISHPGKVFFKVLDDFVGVAERWQHIDKAEHLDLETLIAHGERHHVLIKTGLAE